MPNKFAIAAAIISVSLLGYAASADNCTPECPETSGGMRAAFDDSEANRKAGAFADYYTGEESAQFKTLTGIGGLAASRNPAVISATTEGVQQGQILEYDERGDPDAEPEKVLVNIDEVNAIITRRAEARGRPLKNPERFAKRMVDLSLTYARTNPYVGRTTTPSQVLEFVSLFNYDTVNVRYCAMGVAYAACKAYADIEPNRIAVRAGTVTRTFKSILPDVRNHYFTPSPSCFLMMEAAKGRERNTPGQLGGWVTPGAARPKRGWLVLFDWVDRNTGRRNGIPDHVGIVVDASGPRAAQISTVEYNTSRRTSGSQSDGGAVAEKVRNMSDIIGFIRTY